MSELAVPAAPAPRGGTRHAIACVCGASALFAFAGAAVKAVAVEIPTMEIVLFRSLVACLVLLPMLWRNGGLSALRTRRPWSHVGRVIAGFIGMVTSFYGYAVLPMATVTALGFAMPLCLTILSIPLLGEHVSRRRAAAVVVGLVGVLIMLRPWQQEVGSAGDPGALPLVPVLVVLAGVVSWAVAMISIRKMGAMGERNVTIVLWFSIGSTLLAAVAAVPVWVNPQPLAWLALCAVGVISAGAQLLMTQGYRSGEMALLAPFEYGAILYSTVLGLAIWGEVPDLWSLLGILILVGAGLSVWRAA